MYEPVYGGGALVRPGSVEGGRQIAVTAHDHFERAVEEMRAQFLTVSGQIADELTRLTQHAAISSPGVRDRVITAVGQIASWQQLLRAESDRLPSDPHERCAIMESVLQAQHGALHQLAIIVKQYAPGWYPNLTQGGALYPSVPDAAPSWSPNPPPAPGGGEANGASAPTWYPSPPTVQDLATHGWPQTHGNGYPADMHSARGQPTWPVGNTGAMVPYASARLSDASAHAPFPGRRGQAHAAGPGQYEPTELRPARAHASGSAQSLPVTRRRAELVTYEPGSNNLLWIGLAVLALIFVYLSFPWEIKQREAVAEHKSETQTRAARSEPLAEPPPPPVVASEPSAPPPPRVIVRAPDVEALPPAPSRPAPAASGMILPGGLVAGSPNVAIGTLSPQVGGPAIGREPPDEPTAESAEPAPAPPARTRQREVPSRTEPEPPPPAAEPAPRGDQFVAVLFTNQHEPTVAKAFAELRQQYPQVLGNRKVESQPVRIAKKGVWHRLVVLPAGSREDAADLCGELMGAGYTRCWVKPYH
jgi:hypothetical protein